VRISVAQVEAVKGDFNANLNAHLRWMKAAADTSTDLLIFPELSLTGYEPTLAAGLALDLADTRLDPIQECCDQFQMSVGAGAPMRTDTGICIGMVIFQPRQARWVYSKQYLHEDEKPFFVPGHNDCEVVHEHPRIVPAICYELSMPEHRQRAVELGARVYAASMVKSVRGTAGAIETLTTFARENRIWVVMANAVGVADSEVCGGGSCIINPSGERVAELGPTKEGLLTIGIRP
jgi:predicted amidohydrolase